MKKIFLLLVVLFSEVARAYDSRLFSGEATKVQEAIKQGASVNVEDLNGYTPLMLAANNNRLEIIKLLIDSGADINAKNSVGWNALRYAIYWHHEEIIKLIQDRMEYLEKAKKEVNNYFSDPNAQIFPSYISDIINDYL